MDKKNLGHTVTYRLPKMHGCMFLESIKCTGPRYCEKMKPVRVCTCAVQVYGSFLDNKIKKMSSVLVLSTLALATVWVAMASHARDYTNSFAVEIRGGEKEADELARRHGFKNLGKVRK